MVITNEGLDQRLYGVRHPAKEKIAVFSQFENGWHHGEGQRFSQDTIHRVSALIDECLENTLFEIDVFPGLDADIRLTVYEMPDYYEFTVGERVSYRHETNNIEDTDEEERTLDYALSKIREIGRGKWTSSESSITPSGLINTLTGFRVLHSNAAGEYPYLRNNAL